MSVNVSVNGASQVVNEAGELSWGTALTNILVALAQGTLQANGANFTLTAEGDHGANFGIKALYLKSQSSGLSSAGVLRLAHTDTVGFRNLAGSGDLLLTPNAASNLLSFNGVDLVDVSSAQTLSNKTLSGSVTIGTVVSGVWNGTTIAVANGGTGQTTTLAAFNALSPLTTKGDVLGNDGTNDVRLAVGTNGQLLSADSTAASGLKWITAVGTGSVTTVATAQPAAGLTVTGGPITSSGTLTFALANDLAAIEALNTTGIYARTATDTWAARTITGTTDQVIVTDGSGAAGNPTISLPENIISGNKNALMNGAMEVWQRGTSFAAIATATYSADRWQYAKVGAMVHTVSRDTDVPTFAQSNQIFNYSMKLDVTTVDSSIAAGDYCFIQQAIEGYIWARYAQRAITLSFWIKAGTTGTYCIAVRNTGNDRSFVKEFTVSSANTWEKKIINISASPSAGTWDYLTGAGAYVSIVLACGSTFQSTNNTWNTGNFLATSNQVNATSNTSNDLWITGSQLELGTLTTSVFENRPFSDELRKCQRYYQVIGGTARFVAAAGGHPNEVPLAFMCPMRATPTATLTAGSRNNLTATYPQALPSSNFGGRFAINANAAGDCYAIDETINLTAEL